MPVEIERKFLVRDRSWAVAAGEGKWIRQGYLNDGDRHSLRVRVRDGKKATLTLKFPRSGMSRLEFEYDIPLDEANELLDLCGTAVVEKRRYDIAADGHIWQVDVYEGANAGLMTAEVELRTEDEAVAVPAWVGDEVTGNPQYQNSRLALFPFESWPGDTREYSTALPGAG